MEGKWSDDIGKGLSPNPMNGGGPVVSSRHRQFVAQADSKARPSGNGWPLLLDGI